MSTSTKNSGKQRRKCQQQPVPPLRPRRLKAPSEMDQRAFQLQAKGLTQREIAAKLGVTQPTVHRAIARVVKWTGKSNAEDRAGLNSFEKFKVACKRRRIFLRYTQRLALREFHRSCQTIPVKKKITKLDETQEDGTVAEVRLEEYLKPQYGRNPYLGTAARASHELTVLAAGYLGPGNGSIECDKFIDPEDRWDRAVKRRARRVKRLQEKLAAAEQELAELKAKVGRHSVGLGAGLPTPPTGSTEGLPASDGGDLRSGVSAGSETRAEHVAQPVSRVAEKDPAAYQKYAEEFVANDSRDEPCDKPSDTHPAAKNVSKKAYQNAKVGRHSVARPGCPQDAGSGDCASKMPPRLSLRDRRWHATESQPTL